MAPIQLESGNSASADNYTNVVQHPDPAKAAQHSTVLEELKHLIYRDETRVFDAIGLEGFEPGTIASFIDAAKHTNDLDDRKFLVRYVF